MEDPDRELPMNLAALNPIIGAPGTEGASPACRARCGSSPVAWWRQGASAALPGLLGPCGHRGWAWTPPCTSSAQGERASQLRLPCWAFIAAALIILLTNPW